MFSTIHKYPILPSTNTKAKEMILSGIREGVIVADKQSAGRGRLGRSFFSEKGLFMSVILSPEKISFAPSFLTSATAVAVCRTLREYGFDVGIKWVNDLYFEGKKVCGILTEAVSLGDDICGYVIGIGINLGNGDFPKELSDIATSLPLSVENKETLLLKILGALESALTESVDSLVAYLTEKSVVLGKSIRFFGAKEGEGTAIGLDPLGGLIVRTAENKILTLTTGEISVRIQ
jgi:BirA family biotin operon repressor/biotin-[acetyl-CoA-carboxylase] ligase